MNPDCPGCDVLSNCTDERDRLARDVLALREQIEKMRSTIADCITALEQSYDAREWPADGTSRQETTAAMALIVLNQILPPPLPADADNNKPVSQGNLRTVGGV